MVLRFSFNESDSIVKINTSSISKVYHIFNRFLLLVWNTRAFGLELCKALARWDYLLRRKGHDPSLYTKVWFKHFKVKSPVLLLNFLQQKCTEKGNQSMLIKHYVVTGGVVNVSQSVEESIHRYGYRWERMDSINIALIAICLARFKLLHFSLTI